MRLQRLVRLCLALTALTMLAGCVGLDFSPDGRRLAVTWKDGLALVNTDGSGYELVPNGKNGTFPCWSPDGGSILFLAAQENDSDLLLYDVRSKQTRRIGSDYELPVAWRDDSRGFAAFHKRDESASEIVWFDLSRNEVTSRLSLPEGLSGSIQMFWLKGGNDLVFLGGQDDKGDVYAVESGGIRRITTSGDVIGVGISRDRKRLIWARKGSNPQFGLLSLYEYDLRRQSSIRLPFPERLALVNPDQSHAPESVDYVTFSPDGRRLVLLVTYATTPAGAQEPLKRASCYSMKLDGSDAHLVQQNAPRVEPPWFAGDPDSLYPVWSKDGKQLATFASRDSSGLLSVYRSDGTRGRSVLQGPLKDGE